MADGKVVIDKSYFDALLRRADFHTSPKLLDRPLPVNVYISQGQYDSLLRSSRELEILKNALFQGGLTPATLELLISGAADAPSSQAQPSQTSIIDINKTPSLPDWPQTNWHSNGLGSGNGKPSHGLSPESGAYLAHQHTPRSTPQASRQVSYGVMPPSVADGSASISSDSLMDSDNARAQQGGPILRTLYFVGFNGRTSYRDLLSVIKGGKILSVNIRSEKSATVSFLDAAAHYLNWTKRNDVYLNGKRIEIRWAERQFELNNHISNKIANGATRNIIIRHAMRQGLTEERIRDDMEHIHALVIIEINFKSGDAYVSTNSVHNALFARTCMMSRTTYRGCKIEFFPDECDVPLPTRTQSGKPKPQEPIKRNIQLGNRFNMLNVHDSSSVSDEKDQDPIDITDESHVGDSEDDDDGPIHIKARRGVRLDFLDDDDTV